MTSREQKLAGGLLAFMGTAAVGLLAFQFVIWPLADKKRQADKILSEIDTRNVDIAEILVAEEKFKASRSRSLPADVKVSRGEYANLLEGLLRRADFAAGTYKVIPGEADSKSAPPIAPKKPAYTKLSYEVTVKGEVYHLTDFLKHFYDQPLLHMIKKINVQRPSDARARGRNELDINFTVEALVLDNADDRPTLLPIERRVSLLVGNAAQTAFNFQSVSSGRGSAIPPDNVLAVPSREYLAIPGKNIFFGPPIERNTEEIAKPPEDDASPFVTLTSLTAHEDGTIIADFRDKSTNNDFILTQTADGKVVVETTFDLNGKKKTLRKGLEIIYGTDEGKNLRTWRVRKVSVDEVILEKVGGSDHGDAAMKPKPSSLAMLGGGMGNFVDVPEGKVYRVAMGQSLDAPSLLLSREARTAIFPAARPVRTAAVPTDIVEGRGR